MWAAVEARSGGPLQSAGSRQMDRTRAKGLAVVALACAALAAMAVSVERRRGEVGHPRARLRPRRRHEPVRGLRLRQARARLQVDPQALLPPHPHRQRGRLGQGAPRLGPWIGRLRQRPQGLRQAPSPRARVRLRRVRLARDPGERPRSQDHQVRAVGNREGGPRHPGERQGHLPRQADRQGLRRPPGRQQGEPRRLHARGRRQRDAVLVASERAACAGRRGAVVRALVARGPRLQRLRRHP